MQGVLIFLKENWQFLVQVFVPFVSFIILCLLPKTKVELTHDIIDETVSNLPFWIKEAERRFGSGHGNEKLKYVLKCACSYAAEVSNLTSSKILHCYGDQFVDQIENIMSTPKKKEGN